MRNFTILTCKRLPIAMKGWTSPLVPTISITIFIGGLNCRSIPSSSCSSAVSMYISVGPRSRDVGICTGSMSTTTVPSSFTVAMRLSNLRFSSFSWRTQIVRKYWSKETSHERYERYVYIPFPLLKPSHQEVSLQGQRVGPSYIYLTEM